MTDGKASEHEHGAIPARGEDGPATPGATPASTYRGDGNGPPQLDDKTIGELVFDVSERASVLVREEIELAKTEVAEKFNSLLRGSVVALVAGVFVVLALAMAMHGFAWLLNDLVFDDRFWPGFLIEAALFLLIAAGAGLYAYRAFKRGAPPTPDMAIEEAREIRSTFEES